MLVTGGGNRFFQAFMENGIKNNNISMDGLIEKMIKHRIQLFSILKMEKEKKRHVYGAEHYKKIETVPEDLKPYFASAKGIYIFKNSDPFFGENNKV